jgi:hypothetical protein
MGYIENTDFGINNERQDCKIGTAYVGVLVRGRGRMGEMKIKEHG